MERRSIRLQKILSAAGVASRRAAEAIIREGRVTVNGDIVTVLGTRADPARDDIRVDGRRIRGSQTRRYLLLNKPRGYVTTRRDPQGRPTVMDLLPGLTEYVYPVGRLDVDSEGLLLLTNDGELAAALMHPRHAVERLYEVRVRGVPDSATVKRLAAGILVDGRRTAPATIRLLGAQRAEGGSRALLLVGVREGRHRQVRRMCEAVGHPVLRLRRVQIGPIHDRGLRPGQFRDLTTREVEALRHAVAPAATARGGRR